MMVDQDGSCAICFEPSNALCVDHDHGTGKVRGLLCNNCNILCGMALDSPDTLHNAMVYLGRTKNRT